MSPDFLAPLWVDIPLILRQAFVFQCEIIRLRNIKTNNQYYNKLNLDIFIALYGLLFEGYKSDLY
jgi:hypothetical protein